MVDEFAAAKIYTSQTRGRVEKVKIFKIYSDLILIFI